MLPVPYMLLTPLQAATESGMFCYNAFSLLNSVSFLDFFNGDGKFRDVCQHLHFLIVHKK